MNYEVVYLEEKIATGLRIHTSNKDVTMMKSISDLWHKFFAEGVYESILHKKNDRSIGLYTNYEGDVHGAYDMMVCCEVTDSTNLPLDVKLQIIPAGKYAKFVVHGDVQQGVTAFWTKLWSMDLARKYSCDFEEYQSGYEMSQAEIHIYISLL